MDKLTILSYGSKVRLAAVDLYGYCGRDNHPTLSDLGFLGIVVGNLVNMYDDAGDPVAFRVNVLGGTQFVDLNGDEIPGCDLPTATVCYHVRAADGRVLDLMNHEIEEI